MDGEPVKETIRSEHTLFSAGYRSMRGVKLQQPPFVRFAVAIVHRADYAQTQLLGTAMRDAGVEAFEYPSARDPLHGLCVGLFSPGAFSRPQPDEQGQWLCEAGAREVAFKRVGHNAVTRFAIGTFTVDGELPLPAATGGRGTS